MDGSTSHYRYELGQLSQTDGPSSSDLPFTETQSSQEPALPSFEGIFASMVTQKDRRKDSEACIDQSSVGSDRSFSIYSLIGEDSSSGPCSSTPTSPCDTTASQSEPNVTPTTSASQGDPSSTNEPQVFWAQTVSCLSRPNKMTVAQPENPKRPHYKRCEDKPPYSYSALCAAAILQSDEKALSLADIRDSLGAMFPFFRGPYTGWRESVRHCLSHAKYFTCRSVPRKAGCEPSRRLWTVNQDLLKPTLFRRTRHTAEVIVQYKGYLHEQLGIAPLCADPNSPDQTVRPAKKSARTRANLKLPEQICYQEAAILGTQVVEADDFLRARKEVYGDTDDASGVTSPRAGSVASEWSVESMSGKRKQDSSCEPSTKKARTSTQQTSSETTSSPGYKFSTVTYNHTGLHQTAQYPHYQMPAYQNTNYQTQPYYAPTTQNVPFYSQPYSTGTPTGTTWGDVASGDYQNQHVDRTVGLQAAMELWYYRRMLAQQEYNYNYLWYNPPMENGVDLTVPTSDAEK